MNNRKTIFIMFLAIVFISSVGLSYAYFSSTIQQNDVKDQVVQTGTLELTYTDGPEIVMNNIKPGVTITKEISVKNTGTLSTSYNLVWQELANKIINDEMVIEATCTRLNANGVEEGTCESLSSTPIKRIKIKENVSIEANITHKYNITITFKETNTDQNYNQGKSFTGTLGINEYVENTPIYCTFDGEMVQGAEYVNGQYTYRYMQEFGKNSGNVNSTYDNKIKASFMNYGIENVSVHITYDWINIANDGWGVVLTDRTSTEPVTSKLCTYINNKPVVSMSNMFADSQATKIDLSNFDTSNVTDMSGMFSCSRVTTLDLSSFDTSNVIDMGSMFRSSKATILDLSNFDTSKVTNMSDMFGYSNVTSLDLSNFDTSNVTDMNGMFSGSRVTTLDLSNFDTSKVTDMNSMFSDSQATSLDLSSFDTSNVTDMSWMFADSRATTLDLSSFDTSKVTDMSYMFYECRILKTIYVGNKFITDNVTNSSVMFYYNDDLVGEAGTKGVDVRGYNKTYAKVDGGVDSPGFFTLKTN